MKPLNHFLLLVVWSLLAPLSLAAATETITYNYDAAGRLTNLTGSAGQTIDYAYDNSGNYIRFTSYASTNVSGRGISPDSDHDGIDDAWEQLYFNTLARTGAEDSDGDGVSDLKEFLSGTNPSDAHSKLQLLSSTTAPGPFIIQWQSVVGKTYRVQFKSTLVETNWTDLPGNVTASGTTTLKADSAPDASSRFYRVLLVQ